MQQAIDSALIQGCFGGHTQTVFTESLEGFFEALKHDRFEDIVENTTMDSLLKGFQFFGRSDQYDIGCLMAGTQIPENFSAFAFRKIEVEQNQIRFQQGTHFFCIFEIPGNTADTEAVNFISEVAVDFGDLGIIINNKNL